MINDEEIIKTNLLTDEMPRNVFKCNAYGCGTDVLPTKIFDDFTAF